MIEHQIIRLFTRDKQQHTKYSHRIEALTLDKVILDILKLVSRYYKQYPEHSFISQDELLHYYDYHYPDSKQRQLYTEVIQRAYQLDTSDSLASAVVRQLIEKDTSNKVIHKLLPIVSGEPSPGLIEEAKALIAEHDLLIQAEDSSEESPFIEDDLTELIHDSIEGGLNWGLGCLNQDLGPLPGNTLGHFFAIPDAGKTSFIHYQMASWEPQLAEDQTALWFNNEEGGKKIRLRHFSAVCNATKDQIISNPDRARELFYKRGGHRMKLYDKAVITVEEIEKVCLEHNARIAVVDIGDKIMYRGRSKAGNGADALQGVYDNLREVVKRINKHHRFDMLTTGQAGTTAENKRWLQQSDLYAGKTGKAGAFDYIIGMGWLIEEPERRYFSLCKNKLGTQSLRHVVNFHPLVARFSDG